MIKVELDDNIVLSAYCGEMEPSEKRINQDDSENGFSVAGTSSPSSSISGALSDDSSERTIPYPFLDFAEDAFVQVMFVFPLSHVFYCNYSNPI